jgi:hypothetical protein
MTAALPALRAAQQFVVKGEAALYVEYFRWRTALLAVIIWDLSER